jgi:NAD(P)-dependent dehydrogenase (short-subunit alcohol dehydrogenase family)
MSIRLDKRTALITGASRGIGFAVADAFLGAGADVHILAETASVRDAAETLASRHRRAVESHICDISERDAVEAVARDVPKIDILINNAGVEALTWMDGASIDTLSRVERITRVNILGTWSLTQALLPRLNRGGSIICTASIWSRTAAVGFSGYVASKHGTMGLVRCWAKEFGGRGIRVNAVSPGWVRTEAAMKSIDHLASRTADTQAEIMRAVLNQQSLPGLMEPADVVGTYLFLASDLSASITGQSIQVDRGAFHA